MLNLIPFLDFVSEIFAKPSNITEDGQFILKPIPEPWGGPCTKSGRSICKQSVMRFYTLDHNSYEKIIFVGDGSNDLCAALNLSANDVVCPRQGFALEKLLQENCVQAQVIPWKDGNDLLILGEWSDLSF